MMAARYSRHRPFTRNGASLIRSIWNGSKGIRDLSNDNMLMLQVHKDVGGRSSLARSESFFLCRPSLVRRLHELGSSRVGQSSTAYQTSNTRIAKLLFSPSLGCRAALLSTQQTHQQDGRKDITKQEEEDPFDTLTDRIPERPVSVAEGASYSLVIIAGLAVAAAAVYAVFKELILEPAEYKIFSKSLDRVKHDSQVTVRLGTPIKGYGQESRNRAARQRIPNRIWKDELGIEHVEINFYIRGPNGSGKVYSEMFKDKTDRKWRFTYLIVDVTSPTPVRLMLESYIPS